MLGLFLLTCSSRKNLFIGNTFLFLLFSFFFLSLVGLSSLLLETPKLGLRILFTSQIEFLAMCILFFNSQYVFKARNHMFIDRLAISYRKYTKYVDV